MSFRSSLILGLVAGLLFLTSTQRATAVIRDGGIDPSNLGKGEWIYSMNDATNKLGGHIASVTSEATLFQYYKSIGVRYVLIKMGTGSTPYSGCYASPHQVTANLCNIAHANGVWVFGYTRSSGADIPGESALADSCFNNGADGFDFDAEAEWETKAGNTWITNGPAQAWQLCSMVRGNWPNKFITHAPMPIIYGHFTFPYKEFGYWCDAVLPQIYHFSDARLKGSPSAAFNWSDVNFRVWQNSLYSLPTTNINGVTVNWTNAIKPIIPVQDVYGPAIPGGLLCNSSTGANPDLDVMEFIDYATADPNCVTAGGYRGVNFWRADLHGAQQFAYIQAGTSGNFPTVVNNIVMDDANATSVGPWTAVKVFDAQVINGSTSPSYIGDPAAGGSDIAPFGTNYYKITKGSGGAYMQFNPKVLTAGDYNTYQWHVNRSDASIAVPATISFDNGTSVVNVNQTTNAGTWSFIGKFPFAVGTNGYVRFSDNFPEAAGVALVDGLKMVFIPPAAVPATPSSLIATAIGNSQIDLSWHDNSTNETGFAIFRSTVNGGPYTGIATVGRNVTTFSNTNLAVGPTYYYVVRSTNYLGASPNSNQATPPIPPTITVQPQTQTVSQGGTANFTVGALGTATLLYQWSKGGTPLVNGGNISGATSTNLTLATLAQSDAGDYSVFITNSVGSTTSVTATLTVATVPPSVITQPVNKTVDAGSTVTFSVAPDGTQPLSFQWKKNGNIVLVDGANIAGATTATLTLINVLKAQEGGYSVTITNLYGNTNSQSATLTVN
ncbi:MAG: Fibronectin type domain protein, partial [Verrucomicrobiales bacterium]|nr:Fibronectin type domain protein [Verrucomicrobiales bacterium]